MKNKKQWYIFGSIIIVVLIAWSTNHSFQVFLHRVGLVASPADILLDPSMMNKPSAGAAFEGMITPTEVTVASLPRLTPALFAQNQQYPPEQGEEEGGEWWELFKKEGGGPFPGIPNSLEVKTKNVPPQKGKGPATQSVVGGVGFDGPFGGWACDCTIAVGPNHVLTAVNYQIDIKTKAGVSVQSVALNTFFASSYVGAPRALFDEDSGRYMIAATETHDYTSEFLAVSKTNDPTGGWFIYKIPIISFSGTSTAYGVRLGVNHDMIALAAHFAYPEQGTQIFVFDKSRAIVGAAFTAANSKVFSAATTPWLAGTAGLGAARTYDVGEKNMYLAVWSTGPSISTSYITGPAGSATISLMTPLATPLAGNGTYILSGTPQASQPRYKGNYYTIQTAPGFNDIVFRNGSLFLTSAVVPTVGKVRTSIYWTQIKMDESTGTPVASLVQDGFAADDLSAKDEMSYYYPSLAVDACNDVGIGFSGSSLASYASSYYTGRTATDPLGTMLPVNVGHAGDETYRATMWGDWSGTHVDPVDGSFWTFQNYASKANQSAWYTWTNQFKVSPPPVTATLTFDGNCLSALSQPVTCSDIVTLHSTVKNFCQAIGKVEYYLTDPPGKVTLLATIPGNPAKVLTGDPANLAIAGYSYDYAWDTTKYPNGGNYTVISKVYDLFGNVISPAPLQFILSNGGVPISFPQVTNLTVTNITQTSATVSWNTATPANSELWFNQTSIKDPTQVTSHVVSLSALTANTTYKLNAISYDVASNILYQTAPSSGQLSFMTLP